MPALLNYQIIMAKKNIYYVVVLAMGLLLLTFAGCKDKKPASPLTGFEQNLTNKDSVEVMQLVNEFFQYAESGNFDAAAGMLYKNNVDSVDEEPRPLNNKEIQQVKGLLSSLPIKSHTIDYIKFKETFENEVKCTALIMEAHDDIPEIKTAYYFKPVDHLGSWRLCLVDSHRGDQTVVSKDKKDSMANEFQKGMREKNLSRLKK